MRCTQGFVVTDWSAIHGGVTSALAGLDLAMPNDSGFWGANLTQAVNNGSIPESRLDDMATRYDELLGRRPKYDELQCVDSF